MSETPSKYLALAQKASEIAATTQRYHQTRRACMAALVVKAHDALQPFDGLQATGPGRRDKPFVITVKHNKGYSVDVQIDGYPSEQCVSLSASYDEKADRITLTAYRNVNARRYEPTDRWTFGDSEEQLDAALSMLAEWIGERLITEPGQ